MKPSGRSNPRPHPPDCPSNPCLLHKITYDDFQRNTAGGILRLIFAEVCAAGLSEPLPISNGNRTEWSSIRSVIIRAINKIARPRSGSPICLITSMIKDRIGRHGVLLPINHNFNKICDIISYFLNQNTRNSKFCFASSEKKSHLSARVMARTVQLLRHDAYCPIKLSN